MRALVFARRNIKEMLRDPISYIFCLIMPVALLALMFFVFYDPKTSFWFSLDMLVPGITVFSYGFTMLYMTLLVSKDRSTAFLSRLFASPMRTTDFIFGYTIPGVFLAVLQACICGAAGVVLGIVSGTPLSPIGLLCAIAVNLPAIFIYIGFGILFGTVLTDKTAPGVCSAILSAGGIFSGAWMPVEMYKLSAPGFYTACRIMPFYPATVSGRLAAGLFESTDSALSAMGLGYSDTELIYGVLVTLAYAVVVYGLGVFLFSKKMKSDEK